MKKIMFTLLVACVFCVTARATSVDWQFTTRSTSTGVTGGTAYLILGAAGSYASVDDVTAAAKDSASLTTSGSRMVTNLQTWDKGTKAAGQTDIFSIVVVSSDQKGYYIASSSLNGTYYDPADALTPRPDAIAITVSSAITADSMTSFSGGGGGDVPEPTSGLLLLVGGAMLALRRKQK